MSEVLNIAEALRSGREILAEAEITEPRREANSLLGLALQKNQTFLIAHPEYELSTAEETTFREYVQRRAGREPLQHIAGRQEFYGLEFIVTPDVLIPRPETELLAETAVKLFRDSENVFFCEVGVGSGCISVALLYELKTARAISLDISAKALDIAEQNAVKNNVADRLELGVSDVFSALDKKQVFDLIISNPPYVPAEDVKGLQAEVRDHDPLIALTDGKNGLSIIEKLIIESPQYLKPGGYLLIEIGFNQSFAAREMVDLNVWRALDILPDLQGIPRMVKLQMK
jgi:release factor glutamine methyltransferase